ncbi:chaperonin 10 Kd subunit [Vibrio phage 2.275.O._10N.286.54.E11]|nr:chaperonin 10 Kd subunit [Vibrio phage 2.275.O._10N.286.54.E11]
MSLRMLSDYILVELNEAESTSAGGIAIVKAEQPCVGTVISAGPGKHDQRGNFIECPLKGGETVIFGKASLNQTLEHEGVNYHVMRYEDIFAIEA